MATIVNIKHGRIPECFAKWKIDYSYVDYKELCRYFPQEDHGKPLEELCIKYVMKRTQSLQTAIYDDDFNDFHNDNLLGFELLESNQFHEIEHNWITTSIDKGV